MSRSNRRYVLIIFFAWLAYLISYLGRADYASCILEIVNETGVTRSTAGMVSSVFSLCNAIGQVGSAFLLRKIKPVKFIGIELFTVAAINFLFPNCNSFIFMAVLWGINGCMQSTLLCGATQIFVENLEEPYLSRGAVLLNTVGAVGGTINYVLTWVLIRTVSWKAVFFTVSTLLFILGIVWALLMPKLAPGRKAAKLAVASEVKPDVVSGKKTGAGSGKTSSVESIEKAIDETSEKSSNEAIEKAIDGSEEKSSEETSEKAINNSVDKVPSILSQFAHYGLVFALAGCFFIGFLRESVSLWIPSYISDTFGYSSSLSTIITVFVPGFQVCGALLGGKIGRKLYNLHFPSGVAFAISSLCMLLLLTLSSCSPLITIVLFVINAVCMTAALTFLLSLFPIRFLDHRLASLFVGILNFFVHAGDFFASFGIGWLSEAGGWNLTFGVLGSIAFLAAALCVFGGVICQKEVNSRSGKNRI